jgi:hypothetical protein
MHCFFAILDAAAGTKSRFHVNFAPEFVNVFSEGQTKERKNGNDVKTARF